MTYGTVTINKKKYQYKLDKGMFYTDLYVKRSTDTHYKYRLSFNNITDTINSKTIKEKINKIFLIK